MADESTKRINSRIAKVGDGWAKKFLAQRKAILSKRKIQASGDLAASIEHAVEEGSGQAAVSLLIAFNDYGRIVEMRRFSHDKWGRNAVTRVEDWIRHKGVSRFVPGFMQKYQLKNVPKDFINRAAWGILVARSGGKFRRRPWWNKAKSAALTDLYNQVAEATLDEAANQITESFDFKKYARLRGRQ